MSRTRLFHRNPPSLFILASLLIRIFGFNSFFYGGLEMKARGWGLQGLLPAAAYYYLLQYRNGLCRDTTTATTPAEAVVVAVVATPALAVLVSLPRPRPRANEELEVAVVLTRTDSSSGVACVYTFFALEPWPLGLKPFIPKPLKPIHTYISR